MATVHCSGAADAQLDHRHDVVPRAHRHPDLGIVARVGGEDMVIYREAVAAGSRIRNARDAVVHGAAPPARANALGSTGPIGVVVGAVGRNQRR